MKITVVDDFPPLITLPRGTILGNHHYRTPKAEIIIPAKYVREWDGRMDTETRFVREWMNSLPHQKRRREVVMRSSAAQPPLFVKVGGIAEAIYIDISAAYPSIWQRVGWDVEYLRGEYFSLCPPLHFPFPMEWKIGRSLPVSSNREGWSRVWTGHDIKMKRFLNRHFNPSIRWASLDILQAIASIACKQLGALYFNTDGAILPAQNAAEYGKILRALGLGFKIKGRGHAYAAGMHAVVIGEKIIGAGMGNPKDFSNLVFSLDEAKRLLEKFAERRL